MAKLPGPEDLARPALTVVGGGVTAARPEAVPRLGAEAEGLAALSRSLGQAAETFAAVAQKEREHNEATRVEDAFNSLRNSQLDLSLGAENGFQRLRGGDAVNRPVLEEWTARFDTRAKQISEALPDDKTRERFLQRAAIAKTSFTGDILRHVAHESDVYAVGVLRSTIDTESRSVGASPRDDAEFGFSVDRVNVAVEREGRRLGKTPDEIKESRAKAYDHLWTSRLEAYRLVDPAGALKSFQDNQGRIGPDTRIKLAESLYRDAAPVLAAQLNDAGGPPVTATALARPPRDATSAHLLDYEQGASAERVRADVFGGKLPRGIRNNNPGNIVAGPTKWEGEIEGADPRYASFSTPESGVRALGKNLLSYGAKGIDTVAGIIARWAPATENDTNAYIARVAKDMGVNATEPLNLRDRKTLTALATSIITHENGKNPYSEEMISLGLDAALGGKTFAYEAKRAPAYSVASLTTMSASDALTIQTGNPIIDRLPPDQKINVFQVARTQANQGTNQLREAMKQRVGDTVAAYERGLDPANPPTRTELIATFGQFDGERIAGDMDLSRQFGKDVVSVQQLPSTQQAALLASRAPAAGEGFEVAQKRHDALVRAVESVQKERTQDPALAVMRNAPTVREAFAAYSKADAEKATGAAQAYAAATLAEQTRLEIRNPQVLTKDMVDAIAKRFAEPPKAGEGVGNIMRGMVEQWGKYWPAVGAQLKGKLPPEATVIGLGVTPEAEAILSETAKLKPEQLRQGIPEADMAALRERIRKDLEPLQRSLMWQAGGIETYDNFSDSAEKIATALLQKGIKPKDAVAKAFEGLAGFKYEFEDTWRVPKTALGGDTTIGAIRSGAAAILKDVAAENPVLGDKVPLRVPVAPPSVRPADAEKQWRQTVEANGFWVTTPGDGGLTLYVKSGLSAQPVLGATGAPVTRSWDQISGIGRSMRAATMSDVYDIPGTGGVGKRKPLR